MALSIGARDVHLWLAPRVDKRDSESFCRDVLSRYAARAPADWAFERVGEGKPRIVDPPLPLDFNLSHSGHWMVCAVSGGVAVGVDIEHVARKRDVMRLARRFFGAAEVEALEALPESERRSGFFDLWTLKESAVKARGEALPPMLNKLLFAIEPAASGPAAIATGFAAGDAAGSYLLLDPARDYRLALCWLGEAGASPNLGLMHWRAGEAAVAAPFALRGAT